MLRTYFLITNTSGCMYWSYLGTIHNTVGTLNSMVLKYGNIYVNQNGGWFHQGAIKEVHRVLIQDHFPVDTE